MPVLLSKVGAYRMLCTHPLREIIYDTLDLIVLSSHSFLLNFIVGVVKF